MISFKQLRKRLQEDQLTNTNENVTPIIVVYEPRDLDELLERKRLCVPAMLVLDDSEDSE
ncbi:hypothetical protein KF707_19525 [Candidatus Obscuribacterales bacterium]|nr:hypothetical protein [Candidatus Obscuribacterales bacterium]